MGAVRNVPAMIKAFTAFDPQGTGYVTVSVFRDIFEKLGDVPSPPEIVDDLVAFADPEETGQVSDREREREVGEGKERVRGYGERAQGRKFQRPPTLTRLRFPKTPFSPQVYYEPFVMRMFTEFEAAKKAKEAGNQKK